MSAIKYMLIAVNVVQIILYIWVLSWVLKVSKDPKCECAQNWRKNYIVVFPIISFAVQLIAMSGMFTTAYRNILVLLYLPVFVGWVMFITFGIQYLTALHRSQCECATKNRGGDNALAAYMAIKVSVFLLAIIAFIILMSMFTATVAHESGSNASKAA